MCPDRGRGVPELTLAAAMLPPLELGRRWYVGDATRLSALSRTDRSVARREEVGLCIAFTAPELALVLAQAGLFVK